MVVDWNYIKISIVINISMEYIYRMEAESFLEDGIEKEIKYPKSFVVYRLAHDGKIEYKSKIYQKYNFLL